MKLTKRLLLICLTAVLASGLSILTTGLIVNAYVQSLLAGFGIPLDVPAPGLTGVVRGMIGLKGEEQETGTAGAASGNSGKVEGANRANGAGGANGADGVGGSDRAGEADGANGAGGANGTGGADGADQTAGAANTPEASGRTAGNAADADHSVGADNAGKPSSGADDAPDGALPVMGGVSDEDSSPELVMTPDAIGDIKDNLPADEKLQIFNILMTKLPQTEMQTISALMEGGLTHEEMKEIQDIVSKHVEPEEYEKLMKMIQGGAAVPLTEE